MGEAADLQAVWDAEGVAACFAADEDVLVGGAVPEGAEIEALGLRGRGLPLPRAALGGGGARTVALHINWKNSLARRARTHHHNWAHGGPGPPTVALLDNRTLASRRTFSMWTDTAWFGSWL